MAKPAWQLSICQPAFWFGIAHHPELVEGQAWLTYKLAL
jgi:hypothetical protein